MFHSAAQPSAPGVHQVTVLYTGRGSCRHQCCPVGTTYELWVFALVQDLYVALPVPEQLKQAGDGASSFAFLEKELRFSQM